MARKLGRQLTLTEVEALLAMGCNDCSEFILLGISDTDPCILEDLADIEPYEPDYVLKVLRYGHKEDYKAYLIESSEGE